MGSFKKFQKIKIKNKKPKGFHSVNLLSMPKNFYIIYSKESGYLTVDQIESMRRVLVRGTGRQAYIVFPRLKYYPLVFLGKNARMGKGKGKVKQDIFFTKIISGHIFCYVSNIILSDKKRYKSNDILILKSLKKLPLACSFFKKSL